MLIVRGVNVFPSAIEGIVRRFTAIDEFQVEVFRDGELDEVRVLVEVEDARVAGGPAPDLQRRSRHPPGTSERCRRARCPVTS